MDLQPERVSRARRAVIREFLETRNATVKQIARRFFPGKTPETARKKASRWLCKERRRKRVRARGVVTLNATGRPEVVNGRRCKEEELEHEVLITEAELALDARFTRNVAVGKTIADASFVRNGDRFYIEVDNQNHGPEADAREVGPIRRSRRIHSRHLSHEVAIAAADSQRYAS